MSHTRPRGRSRSRSPTFNRRERLHTGSLSSREKPRDDHYRNAKDDPNDRDRERNRDRDRNKDRWQRRDRSRSDERRGRRSRSREKRHRNEHKDDQADTRVREMSISPDRDEDDEDDDDERIPTPPPAPIISKVVFAFNKPAPKPIKMTLGAAPAAAPPALKAKVASVFNEGSDEEPEEMPAEARMRMRNIGRDTPTSAGPNSFGKTKHGFCDAKNMFQRNLREAMDKVAPPPNNPTSKFPNTIYKLQ